MIKAPADFVAVLTSIVSQRYTHLMAPLCKALNAEYARTIDDENPCVVYKGQVDSEWTVFK